jgi:hypothetical protein
MNKAQLLVALENEREEFLELIDDLDEKTILEKTDQGGWTVKDILSHLTRWEAELVKLLWQLRQGIRPTTAHFSLEDIDVINARWLQEDRSRPLDRILSDFHGVRNQTIRRVETFSDEQLDDDQRYAWLKGQALWQWIASDSFEHEREHINQFQQIRASSQSHNSPPTG